ncbi:hypothetical protein B0T20DRAFT_398258 [Sordaria brevicollis]|uniref:NADH dehydrogenase [ubiquinone] 1 alpha subcomplex subunit 13 n=1 Tax=Sordaria brevicollis TaxID=83679 RepID=A0AAE0NRF7_SORBR|nr:hypothetical protein B0T20DRAFT_398258 [Sordaria brevicollis]
MPQDMPPAGGYDAVQYKMELSPTGMHGLRLVPGIRGSGLRCGDWEHQHGPAQEVRGHRQHRHTTDDQLAYDHDSSSEGIILSWPNLCVARKDRRLTGAAKRLESSSLFSLVLSIVLVRSDIVSAQSRLFTRDFSVETGRRLTNIDFSQRNLPPSAFKPKTLLAFGGLIMVYGWYHVFQGIREQRELAREKMWSRIHLIPALQAEEDRDLVRRHLADVQREKELLGDKAVKVYHSDRYVRPTFAVVPGVTKD